MHLDEASLELFRSGKKNIELRLWDEKRSKIKVGDRLRFTCQGNPKKYLEAEISQLYHAESFKKLLELFPIKATGFDNPRALLSELARIYPEPEEIKWGVVGIGIGPRPLA
jgi:ASC-1-like (ASCH) protein